MTSSSPRKKKAMTLEDFAAAVHRDYVAISKEMVTKADLWPMQRNMKTLEKSVRELRDDVQTITEAMVTKADLADTLANELAKSEYARQLSDIRERVNVLENKLGIKPTRRAA